MRTSVRLGRIAGIEIGINWTWLIVFFLILWTLGVAVFPNQNPGLSTATYWAMAAVATVAFFGSILLHELGHALQARRDDVEIEGITLWLFGGVARFKSMYETPGAEFRIALAGPLVTVAIAGALIPTAVLVDLPTSVDGVAMWLGYINLLILAFNLLPALPLDGGRLLHSALWKARDLDWATRVGAAIGQGFGWLMVGAGVVLAVTGGFVSGLWLVLVGWFLNVAARGEAQHLAVRRALGGLQVREVMSGEPVTVRADMTVGRFMDEVARQTRYTTYPVVDDGRTLGLVTFRCVADVPRSEWDDRTVGDCMVRGDRIPRLAPGQEAEEALETIAESPVRRALVFDDDRLVGLVSETDVRRAVAVNGSRRGGAPTA